jgi:hypothetical protein
MDSTHHAGALPAPATDGQRPWVKRLERGLVIVLTITLCLIAALGLVAIGLIVFFVFAMSDYGSNK